MVAVGNTHPLRDDHKPRGSRAMKGMVRVLILAGACAVAMGLSGCGYESTFTDHFVRYAESQNDQGSELRGDWKRYVEKERERWPRKKEAYLED